MPYTPCVPPEARPLVRTWQRGRTMAVSASPMTFARPSILPELFASLPEPFAASFDPDAPWALLGEPLDAVLAALPPAAIAVRLLPEVHLSGDRIAIGRGACTLLRVVLEWPLFVGHDVEIRHR